ncbi:hypothetical protein O3P69_011044 [Scylla paramamosain]|uniref:Gustatory receptor n=1 Tax=Scylla paramamosain TaxID=85552 RepID=A0AAW0STP1_SCYPA
MRRQIREDQAPHSPLPFPFFTITTASCCSFPPAWQHCRGFTVQWDDKCSGSNSGHQAATVDEAVTQGWCEARGNVWVWRGIVLTHSIHALTPASLTPTGVYRVTPMPFTATPAEEPSQVMSSLCDLENDIRKINKILKVTEAYLSWPILYMLLGGALYITAALYRVLRLAQASQQFVLMCIVVFLLAVYIYSHGAELYRCQVLSCMNHLRDLSATTHHQEVKAQIHRLCHLLLSTAAFSLEGMVTLGHTNITALINLATSYLVVLLQVGEQEAFPNTL